MDENSPMNLIPFVSFVLAVWRISNLLVEEEGPFHVFQRIREMAGIVHDDTGVPSMIPDRFFSNLLSCVWCTSMWVALGMTIFWFLFPQAAFLASIPFALSAGAIMTDKFVKD